MAINPIADSNANLSLIQGQSYDLAFQQTFSTDGGTTSTPVDLTGSHIRFSIKVPGSSKVKLEFTSQVDYADPIGSNPYDPALDPVVCRIFFTDIVNGKYTISISAYRTSYLNVFDDYIYQVERIMPDGTIKTHVLASLTIVEQAGARE